jgi:hypothetical protein
VDAKGKQARDAAVAELDAVVRDLEGVAADLASIRGIYMDRCVSAINSCASKYRKARARIASMD